MINPTSIVLVALGDTLRATLNNMEQKCVIRKIAHPTDWVKSLVIVKKHKTEQMRIWLDPRPST